MSDLLGSKQTLVAGKAWCDKARALLARPSVTGNESGSLIRQLESMFEGAAPLGVDRGAWEELTGRFRKLRTDRSLSDRPAPRASINMQKLAEYVGDALPELERVLKTLETDAADYVRLEPRITALGLTRTGLARLMRLNDKEAPLDAFEDLHVRLSEAEARGLVVVDPAWWPLPEMASLKNAFARAAQELDLAAAMRLIRQVEQLVREAAAETVEVAELRQTLDGKPGAPGPDDLAGWRDLAAIEREFRRIEAACDEAKAEAKKEAESGGPLSESKGRQLEALQPGIDEALSGWAERPLAAKRADGVEGGRERDKGSLAFLRAKCAALQAPTGADAATQRRLREEREWARVERDIIAKWNIYAADFSNLNNRGVDLPASLRTSHVLSRFATDGATYRIGGRIYTVGPSDTAGIALKTPIPPPYPLNRAGQEVRSFIYHR